MLYCKVMAYIHVGRLVECNPLPEEDCFLVLVKIMSNCGKKHGAVGLSFFLDAAFFLGLHKVQPLSSRVFDKTGIAA